MRGKKARRLRQAAVAFLEAKGLPATSGYAWPSFKLGPNNLYKRVMARGKAVDLAAALNGGNYELAEATVPPVPTHQRILVRTGLRAVYQAFKKVAA